MPAAIRVFGGVGHDIEAIAAEQQAVLAGTEACMIERLPFERADRFSVGGAAPGPSMAANRSIHARSASFALRAAAHAPAWRR
jgi:hypothetical protein